MEKDHDHDCLTGCAATFREAMEEGRRIREATPRMEYKPRPAKSFCVSSLLTAADPFPIEGVYEQFDSENYEDYLEMIGAGRMTIGMIMKSGRILTIKFEEDKRWLIRCSTTFKNLVTMAGFNTDIPGKVVENKYQEGVPIKEHLQDWDLREVESTLEYEEGSAPEYHGNKCTCNQDCPSAQVVVEPSLTVTQVPVEGSSHPVSLKLVYQLEPKDQDVLLLQVHKDDEVIAWKRLKRHRDLRRMSVC